MRIFTPGGEVPFAGHPTLGTAHVLVALGHLEAAADEAHVVLGENVGPVPVTVRCVGGEPVWAQLTTAALPEERTAGVPDIATLARVLSLEPEDFVGGTHQPAGASCGLPFLIVPLASVDAVRRARVQQAEWERHLRGHWSAEPLVFAVVRSDDDRADAPPSLADADLRVRVFVPGLAVPEDPATGSANAALAGYLAVRTPRDGTLRWRVAQGIEMGRPSRLEIEAHKQDGQRARGARGRRVGDRHRGDVPAPLTRRGGSIAEAMAPCASSSSAGGGIGGTRSGGCPARSADSPADHTTTRLRPLRLAA